MKRQRFAVWTKVRYRNTSCPTFPAVFVYCSNSQGFNMGALYSAFQSYFDRLAENTQKNGRRNAFLTLSALDKEKACAGCLFLKEVSCQHFNKDLDRGYLCGYFDKQKQRSWWASGRINYGYHAPQPNTRSVPRLFGSEVL